MVHESRVEFGKPVWCHQFMSHTSDHHRSADAQEDFPNQTHLEAHELKTVLLLASFCTFVHTPGISKTDAFGVLHFSSDILERCAMLGNKYDDHRHIFELTPVFLFTVRSSFFFLNSKRFAILPL